jgi:hypothetical protein
VDGAGDVALAKGGHARAIAGVGQRDALVGHMGECEGEVARDRLPRLAAQPGRMVGARAKRFQIGNWGGDHGGRGGQD